MRETYGQQLLTTGANVGVFLRTVELVGVEGEKTLSIGVYKMNAELTLRQEQLIIRLKDKGLKLEAIARQVGVPFCKVNHFIYKIIAEGNYIKMKLMRSGSAKFEPTGKEMPPVHASPCVTMVVDKIEVEDYLKRYGNRVEPIKMPLSKRAKTWNMRGIVIGSSYYTRRL